MLFRQDPLKAFIFDISPINIPSKTKKRNSCPTIARKKTIEDIVSAKHSQTFRAFPQQTNQQQSYTSIKKNIGTQLIQQKTLRNPRILKKPVKIFLEQSNGKEGGQKKSKICSLRKYRLIEPLKPTQLEVILKPSHLSPKKRPSTSIYTQRHKVQHYKEIKSFGAVLRQKINNSLPIKLSRKSCTMDEMLNPSPWVIQLQQSYLH